MAPHIPSEDEVYGYFQTYSNWGRWGAEDQLGTVNFITPAKRRQAASLVREGVSVTCARPLIKTFAPDVTSPTLHFMASTGERWAGRKSAPGSIQASTDFIGVAFHGHTVTHLDSLAHLFWDGKMYNGFPAEKVTASEGATVGSVDLLQHGIVTRGVLLDIARVKGVKWLVPGTPIFPEDLEEAEKVCKVRVGSGDMLLVRTGYLRRRNEEGPSANLSERPGMHAACVPWFHKREISLLGSDVAQDVGPSGYNRVVMPVHQVGMVAMGLWLVDNANLEELAAACERYNRWEFMITLAPLRIPNGTGSPVNPTAIF